MKHLRITFLFIVLIISLNIKAQQNHFIYFQTDNNKPFYLKNQNQVYSSSLTGYLIVPKLKMGLYVFQIGFPKNEFHEQTFHCAVEDKDYGYLIKPLENNRWGLFNLQTFNILKADEILNNASTAPEVKTDVFSTMLSTVVNDPSIKQIDPVNGNKPQIITVREIVKPTTFKQLDVDKKVVGIDSISFLPVNKEAVNIKSGPDNTTAIVKTPMPAIDLKVKDPMENTFVIVRKKIKKTAQGIELIYLETSGGLRDTIDIFIPAEKIKKEKKYLKDTADVNNKIESVSLPIKDSMVGNVKQIEFLALDLPKSEKGLLINNTDSTLPRVTAKSPVINSDCKILANNEDFLKLRKKMAGENHADNMILAAKKTFKLKCFTTEQVKNLSVLFLKDMDKYNFFDVAYPYVQDAQNYQTLQSQLSDNYYIDRFKVMIRH